MGFFDLFRGKTPEGDPSTGGADGFFDVLDADGRLVRYTPDDFDEIWTTTDERRGRPSRRASAGSCSTRSSVAATARTARCSYVPGLAPGGEGLAVPARSRSRSARAM